MRVLAYESQEHNGVVCIRNSDGSGVESSSPAEILEFLRYNAHDVVRVVWDLDSFISIVLRMLPRLALESLAKFDENTTSCGHQLYYLPDRMFRAGRSRYYGIKGFWSTSELSPTTLQETQDKADALAETLTRCGMPDFSRLTSPVSVFEQTDLGKHTYESIPKGYDLPSSCDEALLYASRTDRREWIAAHQLGGFAPGQIWDYDLSAAYSSVARSLLDIRQMVLWKSSALGKRERQATYGFMRGHLVLDPDAGYAHCSPLMTVLPNTLPGNPMGDFGDDYYLTLDELRFIERHELGEFTITDGWFMSPYNGTLAHKPLSGILDYLYSMRSVSPLAATVMKNVANQLIGKFIETRVDGSYGAIRNDIYHALTLARTRIKVAEFLVQNGVKPDELVCVQTDGVRLTRIASTPVHNGMGSWRCNGSFPTVVASPYKVFTEDKKPGHLTYEHIASMVAEHPLSHYYARTVKHRTTMRQALQEGDITKVGLLDDLPAHLDLNSLSREQSRRFPKLPRTGSALLGNHYTSEPIIL